jgi:hypothetical protein
MVKLTLAKAMATLITIKPILAKLIWLTKFG